MKKRIRALIFAVSFIVVFSCSTTYLGRYITWNKADIYDYQNFPSRAVETGPSTFYFHSSREKERDFLGTIKNIRYRTQKGSKELPLEEFLTSTDTTAFLVIRDDTILYEGYFNGFGRDSTCTSFSISKSITSALIGIALEEGLIGSLDDPVFLYLPELGERGLTDITIRHLLAMTSGLKHKFSDSPFSDSTRSYFSLDIRKNALKRKSIEAPGNHFLYDNCHAQLLGMILERTSGMSVSSYTEEKLWIPLETEGDAFWSLDSEQSGFEQMAMGFNARPRDYAKFGRLYLNGGVWKGERIISREWIRASTQTDANENGSEDFYAKNMGNGPYGEFFRELSGYYSYSWWGYRIDEPHSDFFAMGLLDQYLYLCPEKNLMLLRFGEGSGDVYWWPEVLLNIAEAL